MKQFAFPLSIKCADINERNECIKLLKSVGYSPLRDEGYNLFVVTCAAGIRNMYADIPVDNNFNNYHHVDHFNPKLIRDIVSSCTNDTWNKGEPLIDRGSNKFTGCHIAFSEGSLVGERFNYRRPTLSEICDHYGYEIKGRNIVRKNQDRKDDDIENMKQAINDIYNSVTNFISSMYTINKVNKVKQLEAENERLRNKITALETKHEAIKELVNS